MIYLVAFAQPLFIPGTSDMLKEFRRQDGWEATLDDNNRLTLRNPRRCYRGEVLTFGVVGVPFTYRERPDAEETQANPSDREPGGSTEQDERGAGRGHRKRPRGRPVAEGHL